MSRSFRVEFKRSGKTIEVGEGETVLARAIECGVPIDFLCTSGTCGTCKAKLITGEISYAVEPEILWEDDKAEGIVLLCQARPASDLEIEEL